MLRDFLQKHQTIISVIIITLLYLALRIPLLDRPLQNDEIYFSSTYLTAIPSITKGSDLSQNANTTWENDWQRHLSFRLPSVFLFYYYWDKTFGDSEISVHIPTITFGLIGIIFFYYFGLLIFGPKASFFAAIATTLSVAHIGASTTASFLIFEFCIFGATLLSVTRFLLTGNRKLLFLTMALNVIGVVIFYHYFAYLLLQTIIFWLYRNKFNIPRYYFVGVTVLFLGFIGMFSYFYMHGWFNYGAGFWLTNNLSSLVSVIVWLPFSFIAERVIYSCFKNIVLVFCAVPFVLFLVGAIKSIIASFKRMETTSVIRIAVLTIFILPFAIYLIGGVFGVNIGHGQNFSYLLTVYYLFGFYGIEKLNINKKHKYIFLVATFSSFLLFAVLGRCVLSKYHLLEREIPHLASHATTSFNILVGTECFTYPYYKRQYNISGSSFTFDGNTGEAEFTDYLNEIASYFKTVDSFTVIRKINEQTCCLLGYYVINGRTFVLVDQESRYYPYCPVKFFDRMVEHGLTLEINTFKLYEQPVE